MTERTSWPRRVFISGQPHRLLAIDWPTRQHCDQAAALASVAFVFRKAIDADDLPKLIEHIADTLGVAPGLLQLERLSVAG